MTLKLLFRLLFGSRKDDIDKTEWGYDDHYGKFWERGDLFRVNYTYVRNDVPLDPHISSFTFKREGIVTILAEKIGRHKFKSILEIGSGAGENILMLAPLFPGVKFTGVEPAASGVKVANAFFGDPPKEFGDAFRTGRVNNARCVQGNILDKNSYRDLLQEDYDFVYTSAVLEQLHDYIDLAFENIFSICNGYFLFYEEWLEANYLIENYHYLVYNNYFRFSWNILNKYRDVEILERDIPSLQPSWLKYGVVFCRKR
jgi:SAM-dependent methyltransferase